MAPRLGSPVARALLLALALGSASTALAQAAGTMGKVGVDERLGDRVPLDLLLKDEAGAPVRFGDLVDRPTLLSLVYFRCAGICTPLLNGIADVVERTGLRAGRDFRVLTVSFDDRDTPALAASKKRNYLAGLSKEFPTDGWRFLTGDAETTKRLADSIGFRFQRQGGDFVHPAVLTVLSSDGKITRYLQGIAFLPFDVKMAVVEASEGRAVPTASRILRICYGYDAASGRYYLNVTRLAGIAILVALGAFGAASIIRARRRGRGEGRP